MMSDPRSLATSHRDDFVIDQNWAAYTPEEHARWDHLVARQSKLLPGRACKQCLEALDQLQLSDGGIPDFARLNAHLTPLTGWQVVAVPHLVPDDIFFAHLANRRFPAGAFLRGPDQLDYIQEPDVFHDVFGHVPLLANPAFADFMAAYGRAGLAAADHGYLHHLARLYWYTVEFGLIATADGLRIYGAGILSSPAECVFALDDPSPNRLRFDLRRVMATDYRIDDFQETYFVISSFDQLLRETSQNLAAIYRELADRPTLPAAAVLPSDHIITRGTQAYFKTRNPSIHNQGSSR